MSFWKRWTEAAKPRLLDHPLFGTMRFQRGRGGRASYWEGEARFAPTGNELQVFIDAGEDGPGEPQMAFWRSLEARYQALWPALQVILANAYAGWIPDPPPDIHAGDRFTLEFLS